MTTSSYDWLTNTELKTVALQAQNDTTIREHEGTAHTAAHTRH